MRQGRLKQRQANKIRREEKGNVRTETICVSDIDIDRGFINWAFHKICSCEKNHRWKCVAMKTIRKVLCRKIKSENIRRNGFMETCLWLMNLKNSL